MGSAFRGRAADHEGKRLRMRLFLKMYNEMSLLPEFALELAWRRLG
jgi:hypothetical protein